MGEIGRSKIWRMMQCETQVWLHSFRGLVYNSIAAFKKLKNCVCSCTWRPSVIFGASGFIWFTTIVLELELQNPWKEGPSAPCKFQHWVTDAACQESPRDIHYLNCSESRLFWIMGICKGEQWWKLCIYGFKTASGKGISDKILITFRM